MSHSVSWGGQSFRRSPLSILSNPGNDSHGADRPPVRRRGAVVTFLFLFAGGHRGGPVSVRAFPIWHCWYHRLWTFEWIMLRRRHFASLQLWPQLWLAWQPPCGRADARGAVRFHRGLASACYYRSRIAAALQADDGGCGIIPRSEVLRPQHLCVFNRARSRAAFRRTRASARVFSWLFAPLQRAPQLPPAAVPSSAPAPLPSLS